MSYCNNKEYDARRMKDHEAEDRAGDTKQSREDWIASVIAERDLYKGECALLLEAKKSAHSQMEYLRQQLWEMRTKNRVLEADNKKFRDSLIPNTHVLAVGEPCAGQWIAPPDASLRQWSCRCGAKRPEQCKTETAPSL